MKGLSTLVAVQALLSTVSGVLISQMSFIGKVGISVVYREYGIFKIWWKTALLLFAVQLAVVAVLWLVKRLSGRRIAMAVILLVLLFALTGAYFTYLDFTTTSHRMMKTNFHAGVYLFWATWGLACVYFLIVPCRKRAVAADDPTGGPPPMVP